MGASDSSDLRIPHVRLRAPQQRIQGGVIPGVIAQGTPVAEHLRVPEADMQLYVDRPTLSSHVSRAASKLDAVFATTCWSRAWGVALIDLLDAFRIEFDDGFVLNDDGVESLTATECAMLAAYLVRQPRKPWTEWLALYVERTESHEARRAMAFDLAEFAKHHACIRRIGARRRMPRVDTHV